MVNSRADGRLGRRMRGAVVLAVLAALPACASSSGPTTASKSTSHASSSARPRSATATPTVSAVPPTSPTPDPSAVAAQAAAAVQTLIAGQPAGGVSVAAMNTATGATFAAGADSGMWTASAYKLFVLETLLLKRQAGGGLSDREDDEAVPMIEQSDNVAGYSLFEDAGGNSALTSAASTFGMAHTVPGRSDPTFTTTSASDYLVLLRNLVSPGPLNAASQAYALNLMRNVEGDQRWGVGVVADPGSTFANKNGWLSIDNDNAAGEDDGGLWAVTSVGLVTVHGQQLLLAAFTRHQRSMAAGVSLVESLAKAMTPAVAP